MLQKAAKSKSRKQRLESNGSTLFEHVGITKWKGFKFAKFKFYKRVGWSRAWKKYYGSINLC
jgi:hypothetical protein